MQTSCDNSFLFSFETLIFSVHEKITESLDFSVGMWYYVDMIGDDCVCLQKIVRIKLMNESDSLAR